MTYYEKLVKKMDRSMKEHPQSAMLMDVNTFRVVAKGKNLEELTRKISGKMQDVIPFQKPNPEATWILQEFMEQKDLKEEDWAKALGIKLNENLSKIDGKDSGIMVFDGKELPYACEIYGYSSSDEMHPPDVSNTYQTDLLISDHGDNKDWIPRVIIECKLRGINTHDPLTYSAKAATHKHVHPYLRYGILVGGQKTLPQRLVRHGANFDFMLTWKLFEASPEEWSNFYNLLLHEIKVSRELQNVFKRKDKQYRSLHRKLILE
jgi:hypothetical protein